MRARMSHARGTDRTFVETASAALDELRSILATVEPYQHHPMLGNGYVSLTMMSAAYPNAAPFAEMGAALADALHAATLPESVETFVDWLVFCQHPHSRRDDLPLSCQRKG